MALVWPLRSPREVLDMGLPCRDERGHLPLSRGKRRIRDTLPFDDLAYDVAADDPLAGEAGDNMQILGRLIDGLDGLNRALILLYLEGHTSEEIAEIVGISPGNVTTRMNRVKNELQRGFACLESNHETVP